jgi:hypothetical protein
LAQWGNDSISIVERASTAYLAQAMHAVLYIHNHRSICLTAHVSLMKGAGKQAMTWVTRVVVVYVPTYLGKR